MEKYEKSLDRVGVSPLRCRARVEGSEIEMLRARGDITEERTF